MKPTWHALSVLLLISFTTLAHADRRTTLDQAVSEARDRYPGQVISAETRRRDGRESYDIRILTNEGRVKRLRVDPSSGRFERRKQR